MFSVWVHNYFEEAGYRSPDGDKPKVQPRQPKEITGGLLGLRTQQNQKPEKPLDDIFDVLMSMTDK
jgi:hypothetical protein